MEVGKNKENDTSKAMFMAEREEVMERMDTKDWGRKIAVDHKDDVKFILDQTILEQNPANMTRVTQLLARSLARNDIELRNTFLYKIALALKINPAIENKQQLLRHFPKGTITSSVRAAYIKLPFKGKNLFPRMKKPYIKPNAKSRQGGKIPSYVPVQVHKENAPGAVEEMSRAELLDKIDVLINIGKVQELEIENLKSYIRKLEEGDGRYTPEEFAKAMSLAKEVQKYEGQAGALNKVTKGAMDG